MADDNASVGDSAFGGGGDGGAVPLSGPSYGSRVDGEANSLCADGTGRDDADEDDRRAAGSLPSTDKRQDCDRLTCRALLSDIPQRFLIRNYIVVYVRTMTNILPGFSHSTTASIAYIDLSFYLFEPFLTRSSSMRFSLLESFRSLTITTSTVLATFYRIHFP